MVLADLRLSACHQKGQEREVGEEFADRTHVTKVRSGQESRCSSGKPSGGKTRENYRWPWGLMGGHQSCRRLPSSEA